MSILQRVIIGCVAGGLAIAGVSLARLQVGRDARDLADIVLPAAVWADGQFLEEGSYRLRREDAPAAGEMEAQGGCWVELVRDGVVRGRELATVVTPEQAQRLNRGASRPPANEALVDVVRANAFVRIWVNRGSVDYVLNLPLAPTTK